MSSSAKPSRTLDQKLLNHFLEAYLQARPFFFSFIRPQEAYLFAQHRHLLKPPVLDFGAGDGFFAQTVFNSQRVDIGLDVPHPRVPEAIHSQAYRNLVLYDGLHLPFKSNSIGSVFSNCVLEHLPALEQDMAEIFRVLQPGGYFLASAMTHRWEDYLLGSSLLGKPWKKYMRQVQIHHNLLTPKQWVSLFHQLGFAIESCSGYLNRSLSQSLHASHYVSVPSLVSRKLIDQWVIWPSWYKPLQLQKRLRPMLLQGLQTHPEESAALFFVLRKPLSTAKVAKS